MSLEPYRKPRLIVQKSETSVHDAARAMQSNHIGVVVVQDRGHIVGIVTDRDLAMRVVGYGLDPKATTLGEIMTPDVVTLPIGAAMEAAVELMLQRHIRRIPLLEGTKLVGLVTVDDLILDGGFAEGVARIVRAQLSEPSALKPGGAVFPTGPALKNRSGTLENRAQRHAARAEETFGRLLHRVQAMTGLETRELTATALDLVLQGILCRITPGEAADLISQLPSVLHEHLLDLPAGPDRSITRDTLEQALAKRLDLSPERSARLLMDVGAALEQAVSAGEIEDVRGQLPKNMRAIFPRASA